MRSQLGLVVAHSTCSGSSQLGYVRGAVGNPVSLAIGVFAGCIGLGYAGVLGAAVAAIAVVALGVHAARYRAVRNYLDGQAQLRAHAARETQRLRRLRPTGAVRTQHYQELQALVEEIERLDAAQAAQFELQDLLDHWIELAVTHQRCAESLQMAAANELPSTPIDNAARSERRRDILQRRILHRDECVRTMENIADELEGTDELIRLLAQRAACPSLDRDHDRELDRRLWELDTVDAALHHLSA